MNPTADEPDGGAGPTVPAGGPPSQAFDATVKLDRSIIGGDPTLPTGFGRYEVLRRIGIGGFASVYAGRDPGLDAPVAIKVLAENHAADVEVRRRFVAEARLARRVGTDRLVGVFDIGETDDGRPYVVMELADRGTLRARMNRLGRPSLDAIERLVTELGACLAAIHAKGVVHRDIKPSNLLLRSRPTDGAGPDDGRGHHGGIDGDGDDHGRPLIADDEQLVLADFGLARDISSGASAVTVGGGTVGYMAPEQGDPRGKADHRADLFAASVVVAEAATGRNPERLDLTTSGLPPGFIDALTDGMDLDRERRPQRAEDWTARLLAALDDEGPTRIIPATRIFHPENEDPTAIRMADVVAPDDPSTDIATPEIEQRARIYVRPPADEAPPPPPALPPDGPSSSPTGGAAPTPPEASSGTDPGGRPTPGPLPRCRPTSHPPRPGTHPRPTSDPPRPGTHPRSPASAGPGRSPAATTTAGRTANVDASTADARRSPATGPPAWPRAPDHRPHGPRPSSGPAHRRHLPDSTGGTAAGRSAGGRTGPDVAPGGAEPGGGRAAEPGTPQDG